MEKFFNKKTEQVAKKIYSNIDTPYIIKDRLKNLKKNIKEFLKLIIGTSNLDDCEHQKLIDLLYVQSLSLNQIVREIKPELMVKPQMKLVLLDKTVFSYCLFPLKIMRSVTLYFFNIVVHLVKAKIYTKKIENSLRALYDLGIIDIDVSTYLFSLTDMAKKIFFITKEKAMSKEELEVLYNWTLDIADKQYRAYDWNDSKVQCLLTVDAALMAGVIFVLQLLGDGQIKISNVSLFIFAVSFLFLVVSLIVCLIHSIPILNSKLGDGHNLRTIVGIESFARYEKFFNQRYTSNKRYKATDKYFESLSNLSLLDMVHMNAWQIVGMSKNNVTSNIYIRKGVISTIVGVATLMIAIIVMAIQNIIF